MTSTSFNVGLNSSTRNSSKVLKPPGGGSSDIFGSSGEPNEPQRKVKNHLTSSIFTSEDTVTPSRNKADTQASAESAVNGASSSTNSSASTPAPTPSAPAPPPTTGNSGKQRVPPGGFSSGLW